MAAYYYVEGNRKTIQVLIVHEITLFRVPVAKFLVPDWGDKVVEYGIGLPYWPASLCSLAGLYENPIS